MENKESIVTEKYDSYKVCYKDNYLFVGNYIDEKIKGVSFEYKNKSIRYIDNDSITEIDGNTYKYGIIVDNNGLKLGLFSFNNDEIKESISVNYENNNILVLNRDKKAVIDNDNVRFFFKDNELKSIKHNAKIDYPKFIDNIEDMKLIDLDNREKKIFKEIEYTKLMESDNCSLYINTMVTDRFTKLLISKNVIIRIMLVSNNENTLFTLSNYENSSIDKDKYSYIVKFENIAFVEFKENGLTLDLKYRDYLTTDFKFQNGRINIFDASAIKLINKKSTKIYGIDEVYGDPHIVNMKDVTANIKLKNNNEIDAEEKLNNLIGLAAAKLQIKRFKNTCVKAMENGYPINLHMMFLGNPGTGKTTFARLVADIFYKYGILPTNNYIEGSRDTLVGQYTGETEEKTNAIFQRAMGGVLFIDEAYSLYRPSTPNDFGNIAMAELIKLMEDYRGKICVIFAGYTKEMHNLLRINSGLKSRIQYEIQFDDYNKEELRQILDINLKNDNYQIGDDEANLLIDFIDKKRGSLDFANAREVRTAFEQVTMIQAERTYKTDINDRKILRCDVDKFISENTIKKRNNDTLSYKMIDYDYLNKCSEISLDLNNDYEKIIESCIEIAVTTSSGLAKSSAFIISPDGYAITAAHSVRDAVKINARRRILDRLYNTVETYHKCYICGVDDKADIAIIKLDNEYDNKFPYLPLYNSSEYLPIFREVIVFGYPLGTNMYDNLSGFKGYISSVQNDNNKKIYNLDVMAMPGSSGACVIDLKTMKVIGIINGLKAYDDYGIPFGCPIQEAWKLVRGEENV